MATWQRLIAYVGEMVYFLPIVNDIVIKGLVTVETLNVVHHAPLSEFE